MFPAVETILVDARNIETWYPVLLEHCSKEEAFIGYDIESHGRNFHEGLKKLMKVDDEHFNHGTKLIFDFKRTVITGCSFYFGQSLPDKSFYLNFEHADVENRLAVYRMFELLDRIKTSRGRLIIHNAQYELAVIKGSYNYDLPETLCSMQLCVTAYNPDTYPHSKLIDGVIKGIKPLVINIDRYFHHIPENGLTFQQEEILNKFCAKQGDASHSYEGIVKSIAYGYALKKAVKSWFGYQMAEFGETLGEEPDMAALTGQQVASYGADDAIWCYRLFFHMIKWLQVNNPQAIKVYTEVENPITRIFAECTARGMSVNLSEIYRMRDVKRIEAAETLVKMKQVLRQIMPTTLPELHPKLLKYEKWYKPESNVKYFNLLRSWLDAPDNVSEYEICTQVSAAVGNAWFQDKNNVYTKPKGLMSINHFMAMRYILFVICGLDMKVAEGKVLSDKHARSEMGDHPILALYAKLGEIEQSMKLYITAYLHMTDPETERMHPSMTSTLATRRTSCSNPNAQQLSKNSESAYVRGFYEADDEDHVLISADYGGIELVAIGAHSQDPEFLKAYGKTNRIDLHTTALSGILKKPADELKTLVNYKELRRDIGKVANFGYWFSGALSSTAKVMKWTAEEMWEAVEGYRNQFPVAEKWRTDTIQNVRDKGFVRLKDGLIRYRFEATDQWYELMMIAFNSYGSPAMKNFAYHALKRIQRRAGNQAVNAMIQGCCASLAKRAVIKTEQGIQTRGYDANIKLLVHDEILASVHKSQALEFCNFLYDIMTEDSEMFPNVSIDSSVAMGFNFQPFNAEHTTGQWGQIELFELNKGLPCVDPSRWGEKANLTERQAILDYLTNRG